MFDRKHAAAPVDCQQENQGRQRAVRRSGRLGSRSSDEKSTHAGTDILSHGICEICGSPKWVETRSAGYWAKTPIEFTPQISENVGFPLGDGPANLYLCAFPTSSAESRGGGR
jgi:hypothetical protein